MNGILSDRQRTDLRQRMQSTTDAQVCRRSGALLSLDEGRSVAEVAHDFGVTRQTLHNWRQRIEADRWQLEDAPRSGRPTKWTPEAVAELEHALNCSPREFGFQMVGWTSGLLKTLLVQKHGLIVSEESVRSKLRDLGYVWKRFRYRLQPDPKRGEKTTNPPCYQ